MKPSAVTEFKQVLTMKRLLLLLAVAGASMPAADIGKLAAECGAGEQKACANLAEIARKDKDWQKRKAAVGKLTDQATLADVAKIDSNVDVRNAAVAKLTDQAALIQVAKTDSGADVRRAAVEKLTSQAALADIALADTDAAVCKAAIRNLTDQAALARVVTDSREVDARKEALAKVQDTVLLTGIVKACGVDDATRQEAFERLTPEANFLSIAQTSCAGKWRIPAAARVGDPAARRKLYSELAHGRQETAVRLGAIHALADESVLNELAADSAEQVRRAATRRLRVLKTEDPLTLLVGRWEMGCELKVAFAGPNGETGSLNFSFPIEIAYAPGRNGVTGGDIAGNGVYTHFWNRFSPIQIESAGSCSLGIARTPSGAYLGALATFTRFAGSGRSSTLQCLNIPLTYSLESGFAGEGECSFLGGQLKARASIQFDETGGHRWELTTTPSDVSLNSRLSYVFVFSPGK